MLLESSRQLLSFLFKKEHVFFYLINCLATNAFTKEPPIHPDVFVSFLQGSCVLITTATCLFLLNVGGTIIRNNYRLADGWGYLAFEFSSLLWHKDEWNETCSTNAAHSFFLLLVACCKLFSVSFVLDRFANLIADFNLKGGERKELFEMIKR